MRLFLGTMLALPQQLLVGEVQESLAQAKGAKPVAPNKLHMTWLFLGEVGESKLESLRGKLKVLLAREKLASYKLPETLQFDQAVIWPNPGKPDLPGYMVLVPSDKQDLEPIINLGKLFRRELSSYVEKGDNSAFRPHITVWRFKPAEDTVSLAKQALETSCSSKLLPLRLAIDKLALIQSHTGDARNHYEVVEHHSLRDVNIN